MKIVVIGGTGLIGSKVVAGLREEDHEAVAASPDSGVNTLTGEGLPEVLDGASVVIDVSNSPSFEDEAVMEFFTTSTTNLLAAEADAGVRHHVALSVVGTERLSESGYLRAKIAQEKLIGDSSIPYSIVHATQFFEFVKSIADGATDGDTVRLAHVLIQPIAADDVAAAVCEISQGHRPTASSRSRAPSSSASTSSSARACGRRAIRAPSSPTPRRATSAPSCRSAPCCRPTQSTSATPASTTGWPARRGVGRMPAVTPPMSPSRVGLSVTPGLPPGEPLLPSRRTWSRRRA